MMSSLSSLHLYHHQHNLPYLPSKTHLQRRGNFREFHSRIILTPPKMSISSNSNSVERVPITEEFFIKNISGRHNEEICGILFPDWDLQKGLQFTDDKEAMFRKLASEQLKPMSGLRNLCKWIEGCGLKRAAVTNAPRPNAELIISILGLSDFFQIIVIGEECDRAKPFPDPYLQALQALKASPDHTFVFEDSVSGIKAGVAAGMPVLGISKRNPEKMLMEAGATFLIKDFSEPKLWSMLEELEKEAVRTTVST